MKITPIFAWYDLWVGAFWDSGKRRLYLLPLPCFGVVIQFRRRCIQCRAKLPYEIWGPLARCDTCVGAEMLRYSWPHCLREEGEQ